MQEGNFSSVLAPSGSSLTQKQLPQMVFASFQDQKNQGHLCEKRMSNQNVPRVTVKAAMREVAVIENNKMIISAI